MTISMFLAVFFFQCDFGWNQVKCARISPLSLFLHFLQVFPVFFSPGRDQLRGRRDRKISAPVSALYMSFGSQGWTALLELIDTAGPKV